MLRLRGSCIALVVLALPVLLWVLPAQAARPEAQIGQPRVYWRNGDVCPGRILSATDTELQWQCDVFQDPLRLRLDALQMIRFPERTNDGDDFEPDRRSQIIETHDGNRFFGRVTDSDHQFVTVDTDLFGELRLERTAISLIANPIERAHVYSGPSGLHGWSTLTYGRKLEEWKEISLGRLTTRMVAAELYRSLPTNGSVDLDVEFLWRHNPSFQIRFLTPFAEPTKETIKIETRSGGYAVQSLGSDGRFRQLETLPKQTEKCRLLLRWNHSASELTIFRDRKYLGKMAVQRQSKTGPAGIFIKNTGPQLTLSRLEVRASSSLDINLADAAQDTILRADNASLTGTIKSLDRQRVALESGTETTSIAWPQIAEIAFRAAESGDMESAETYAECVFQNGETLKGMILAADATHLQLRVPSIDRPLSCAYATLERIVLGPKTLPPKIGTPFIMAGELRLHGALDVGRADALAWMPTGGTQPSRPAPQLDAQIELTTPKKTTAGGPQQDLLYLRNGDVLPCQVHAAGPVQLEISSRFTGRRTVASDDVHAVELSVTPIAALEGFDDRWEANHGKAVEVQEHEIRFSGSAKVTRHGILNGCDEVAFKMRRTLGKAGIFVHLTLLGDNLQVEDRTLPFYFNDQKLFVLGSKRNAFVPCRQGTTDFDILIETHDPFRVEVNGNTIYTIPGLENGGPWSGLAVEVSDGPLFGPAVRLKKEPVGVSIADLRIRQTKRPSIRQTTRGLDADALLTIPRNRTKHSLTHLAVGTNNDIVRGNLIRLDGDRVQMQSKYESISLSRDAVAGLIWLHEDDLPESKDPGRTRVVLDDTTTMSLTTTSLDASLLRGQHPVLGACQIERDEVQSILMGNAPNQFHQHAFVQWKAKAAPQPAFATSASDGHRLTSPLIGKPIEFDAELLDTGQTLNLSAYRGKVVVLDFWASWCAPCIRNMPDLIQCISKFSADQVELIAVNQGDSTETIVSLLKAKNWDLAVATDPQSSASQVLSIPALPQTIVLDQDGEVTAVFVGASSRLHQELTAELKMLLGE